MRGTCARPPGGPDTSNRRWVADRAALIGVGLLFRIACGRQIIGMPNSPRRARTGQRWNSSANPDLVLGHCYTEGVEMTPLTSACIG